MLFDDVKGHMLNCDVLLSSGGEHPKLEDMPSKQIVDNYLEGQVPIIVITKFLRAFRSRMAVGR